MPLDAFIWEVYECLYYPFDHSENILAAVCFEQRLRNRKGRIMHYTSAKLFCGKRDTISDCTIVPPIVCSYLHDDRFALFLPNSRILCNDFSIVLAHASVTFLWTLIGFSYACERKQNLVALCTHIYWTQIFYLKNLHKLLNQTGQVVILNQITI